MTLINVEHYPAVRAAIDVSLTSEALPDTVIELPIFQGAAEAAIEARDPSAASRTGAEQDSIQRAAIYLTAALLAPTVPQIVSAKSQTLSYQRSEIDWQKLVDRLRGMVDDELEALGIERVHGRLPYSSDSVSIVTVF